MLLISVRLPFHPTNTNTDLTSPTENLHPFTRWITPPNMPKRFTTQMYLYMLPLSASTSKREVIHTPSHDGGLEHTAATFDDGRNWLARTHSGEVVLFPPQCYLLHLVAQFMTGPPASGSTGEGHYQRQRDALMEFVKRVPTAEGKHATAGIPWAEKAMSPTVLFVKKGDKRTVLGLDKPGPELKESGRGGDWERVVLVRFTKEMGPQGVEVRRRDEVLREEREGKKEKGKL